MRHPLALADARRHGLTTGRAPALASALFAAVLVTGCGPGAIKESKLGEFERHAEPATPLGPSFVLLAQPTDDVGLLGRMLQGPPDDSKPLDELSAPNPCADKLAEPKASPTLNSFEDAEELGIGAHAQATLGKFGFRADASHATHFVYKLETTKRVARIETPEYLACCAEKGCGYGYVSTLVFGTGEYASARETDVSGHVEVAIASGEGAAALSVLHKRNVQGYLAALVTRHASTTSATSAPAPAPPPAPAAHAPEFSSAQARAEYEEHKIGVCARADLPKTEKGITQWSFCDPKGNLTENEFVRRYRATTGFHELDDKEFDRAKVALYYGIPSAVLGAGLLTYGVAFQSPPPPDPCLADPKVMCKPQTDARLGEIIVGSVLLGNAVVDGIIWLNGHDGEPNENVMPERDARLAAARFNRALARNIASGRGTRTESSGLRIRPRIGLGSVGLGGTFQ